MKILSFKTLIILLLCLAAYFSGCKVKKQITTDGKIANRSISETSDNEQTKADLTQQISDNSKTIKKDSAIISVTEKQDIEYDYSNTTAMQPSKIIRHIERTTNFQTGSSLVKQNNIKSNTTVQLKGTEKKTETKTTKTKESQRSALSITSSSRLWIWAFFGLLLLLAILIYLIKKFNLINLIKTVISGVL